MFGRFGRRALISAFALTVAARGCGFICGAPFGRQASFYCAYPAKRILGGIIIVTGFAKGFNGGVKFFQAITRNPQ
jgi:hypothetical protein